MSNNVQENLVYLCKHLCNLKIILDYLLQQKIITNYEKDTILLPLKAPYDRNSELLSLLDKKDWSRVYDHFLEILRNTNNDHCADILEGKPFPKSGKTIQVINNKWWPEELRLVTSFYKRKIDDRYIVEEILKLLESNEDKTIISSQKVAVSGLGGIGKSTTAKWFARFYADKYDYIIWLDCGEGSLLKSLRLLAKDLKINESEHLTLLGASQKCFKKLENNKCLFIYDNAEWLVGKEEIVILNILPKNENFHTIITSRDNYWGTVGCYGKISCFQLKVFDRNDTIQFFKENLNNLNPTEIELSQLSDLLGNFPLALQIAAATLNGANNISVAEYIRGVKKTAGANIIHKNFEDIYRRSIFQTLKISLDQMKNADEISKMAYEILGLCGYIRPDDIETVFLADIVDEPLPSVENAVDLLERYSLLTRTGKDTRRCKGVGPGVSQVNKFFAEEDNDGLNSIETFSVAQIHRLLQQVLRCYHKEDEKQILTKILSSRNFIENKLEPYKYLIQNFPKLKSKFRHIEKCLIDELDLRQLLKYHKYKEAKKMSWIICQKYKGRISSLFNHAICLAMIGKFKKSLERFLKFHMDWEPTSSDRDKPFSFKILKLILDNEDEPDTLMIGFWIVYLHKKLGQTDNKLECLVLEHMKKMGIEVTWTGLYPETVIVGPQCYVLYEKNYTSSDFIPAKLLIDRFEIKGTIFVDSDGRYLPSVSFPTLPYVKKLAISSGSKTHFCVDLSKLSESVLDIELSNVSLSCNGINDHLENVSLAGNSIMNIYDILQNCPKLKSLAIEATKFILQPHRIPTSIKCLEFKATTVVVFSPPPPPIKIDLLLLSDYHFKEPNEECSLKEFLMLRTVCSIIHSKVLLFQYNIRFNNQQLQQVTYATKNCFTHLADFLGRCNHEKVIFGGSNWKKLRLIKRLHLPCIDENSDYYVSENETVKAIRIEEVNAMLKQYNIVITSEQILPFFNGFYNHSNENALLW